MKYALDLISNLQTYTKFFFEGIPLFVLIFYSVNAFSQCDLQPVFYQSLLNWPDENNVIDLVESIEPVDKWYLIGPSGYELLNEAPMVNILPDVQINQILEFSLRFSANACYDVEPFFDSVPELTQEEITPVGTYTYESSWSFVSSTSGQRTFNIELRNQETGATLITSRFSINVTPIPTYLLTIDLAEQTSGTPRISHLYQAGTLVPYEYSVDPCFDSLSVLLDGVPYPTSGTILMDSDHVLTTTVSPKTMSLNISATDGGTTVPSGIFSSQCGDTIQATPDSGYIFAYWTNDVWVGGDSVLVVDADTPQALEAHFRKTEPMVTGNTSYAHAMPIQPISGTYDINIICNINTNTQGSILNIHDSGTDDIEAVFTFTLSNPTALTIAVEPALQEADLDLFIFKGTKSNGNFFDYDPHTDPFVDYSAHAFGNENLCRVFQPGTYYILVSLFEGSTISSTPFGLLVTEYPIYMNTFNTSQDVDDYYNTFWLTHSDTNYTADWSFMYWPEYKFGNALSEDSANGNTEHSGLESAIMVRAPSEGEELFINFDACMLAYSPYSDGPSSLSLYAHYPGETHLVLVHGFQYSNMGDITGSLSVNNNIIKTWGYHSWIRSVLGTSGDPDDFRFSNGEQFSFVIYCTNERESWAIDNIRVFSVKTQY